jgi:hypothetical protein
MSDIIDINVGETIEEVTINVTDNLITVNINKVTGGGGGTQTLAQTLDLGNETGGTDILLNNDDAIVLENNSSIRKGTYDFGQNGGVSRICGVDYEDMWQGGIRHVFDQNGFIRNSTNGFNSPPNFSFDASLRFKVGSFWTLDDGTTYICTDATVGAAVWEIYSVGSTPTLQQVTDKGSETTQIIKVKDSEKSATLQSNSINFQDLELNGSTLLRFLPTNVLDQEIQIRGLSGTMALTSDIPAAQVNADWNATSGVEEILNKPTIPAEQIQSDWTQANTSALDYIKNKPTVGSGTVTSVGLTMPSAFSVTNSPITSSGNIAVTGAGLVSQYVRGDGTLANFPNSTGGGSSVNYYLNGSVSQGTFGGTTYYQMSKTPILGAGTNFTRTNGQGNGYIASFITDAGDPSFLNIPAGNWNLEFYFQSSSTGGSPQFYAEIYKVSATNVFTLVASGSANPEGITNGTTIDQYFTSISVPQTSLLITDRLAIRIYVITSGRTITLHTENGNLCEVLTTFTTGLTALNGLTQQVQNLAVGTSGTDFAISSSTDTHTFNLPTASASNRGALSSTDWSTFNNKQNALGFTAEDVANKQTDLTASATKYPTVNAVNTGLALKQNVLSYTPYKNFQVSSTPITGTLSETIAFTATIPAGTYNATDILRLLFGLNKTTTLGTYTLKLRVNTTNTISGAPTIATYNSTSSAQSVIMTRNYNLNGGNLNGYPFTTTVLNDTLAASPVNSSTTLNPANIFYIFGTIQLSNILDSITPTFFNINN